MKTLLNIYKNYNKELLESFTRKTKRTDSEGLVSKSDRMVINKKEYLMNLILSHSNFYDQRTDSKGINFGHTFQMTMISSQSKRTINVTIVSYYPDEYKKGEEVVFYSSPFSRPTSFLNIIRGMRLENGEDENDILETVYEQLIEKIEIKVKLDSLNKVSESFTKRTKGTDNNKLSDKADDMVDEIRIKRLVKELCSLIERFGKKSSGSFHFKFNTKSPSTLKRLPTFDKFPYFDDFNATQVWLHTDFKNPDDRLQFNILNHNIYVSIPELIEMFGTEQVIRLLEESISIIKEMEKIRMELERIGTKAFLQKYFK